MRSVARTECIKSLMKLKRQEEVIEKSLDHFLDNMKLEPEIFQLLKSERCSRALKRKKLANSFRTSIIGLKNCLREIKSSVDDARDDRQIDVDSFGAKLISLANEIRELNEVSSVESLTNEETELDRDVREFSLVLAKYGNKIWSERKKRTESVVTNCHRYKSVTDFDALIAKTGHTQNWSESDHLFFLKVRKNGENVPSMVSAIRKKCPDLTAERIVNHEAWYKIYLYLREKQRSGIREWRKNRESERSAKIYENSEGEDRLAEASERGENPESEVNNSDSDVIDARRDVNVKKTNDNGTSDKRELLKQWRADRERARSIETERSRSAVESREAWKENRRLARANSVKKAVSAYREKRMERTSSNSTDSVTDLERITSGSKVTKLIKAFRRRDEEFLKRRNATLERKKPHPIGVLRHGIRSRSSIEQSTLSNPTKVWLEKCKAIERADPEMFPRGVSYVKYIPKLGTYNWRNRESA